MAEELTKSGTEPPSQDLRARTALVVLLLYAVLAAYVTMPLAQALDGAVLARVGQGDFRSWILESGMTEAAARGLLHGVLVDPTRLSERMSYGNLSDFLLNLPLRLAFPFPLHFNLTALLILTLDGFCGFLLLFHLTRNLGVSVGLGGVLAWNPITIRELQDGRPHLAILCFIYLFVLALHRLRDGAPPSNTARAAAWLLLNCMTFWFYGFGAFFLLVIFAVAHAWGGPSRAAFAKRLGVLLLVSACLIGPLIHWARGYMAHETQVEWFKEFPDVRAICAYGPRKIVGYSLDGDFPWARYRWLLLGALLPCVLRRRVSLFPLLAMGFFYLLCVGPVLKSQGQWVERGHDLVQMPYRYMYQYCPFFSRLHEPERMEVFFLLAMVIMCAENLAWFLERAARTPRRALVAQGLVGALVLVPLFEGPRAYHVDSLAALYPFASHVAGQEVLALPPATGERSFDEQRIARYWQEYYLVLATWRPGTRITGVGCDAAGAGTTWFTVEAEAQLPPGGEEVDLRRPDTLSRFGTVLVNPFVPLEHVEARRLEETRACPIRCVRMVGESLGPPLMIEGHALFRRGAR